MAVVFDVEGNGYLEFINKLHCIVTVDVNLEEIRAYHDYPMYPVHGTLDQGLQALCESDCIIGHNITGFDIPAIHKVHPDLPIYDPFVIDTQKLAEILFPEVKKQSIEWWTNYLKLPDPKIHISDFSVLTPKLLERCVIDAKNNLAIYKFLINRKHNEERDGTSFKQALLTEQRVSDIHASQVQHGVYYNVDLAMKTVEEFTTTMDEIQHKVQEMAPPNMSIGSLSREKQKVLMAESVLPGFQGYLPGTTPFKALKFAQGAIIKPMKKNGKYTTATRDLFGELTHTVKGPYCRVTFDPTEIYTAHALSYFGDYISQVKGPYNKIEFSPINCSSDTQVKDYLLSIGWIPVEYNTNDDGARTSPKLTEESYVSLPEGLGQSIATYKILQHRRNLIYNMKDPENKGAISKVRPDGRVSAEAFTCGTPTARYRHSGAVCNIPRPKSKFGREIRRLYGVAKKHLQIGIDLSGIEARMLTHFCYMFEGGPEFAELVNNGDWHTENSILWSCDRDSAKTELYALVTWRM